ncbi:hypothetical protein GCM10017557_53270 [Streptomyces aurantiacus]|uniref:Uncharacterized protein n=1 Tax=Streptomyces aurantiacus TaxID=47760 RepID=A0A7G1P543_9ACTN|nr:hypothetical protein GCM10017557_53270 [Streptomyces aurantiacus]
MIVQMMRPYSSWSRTRAAAAVFVMRLGSRLTLRRALEVILSQDHYRLLETAQRAPPPAGLDPGPVVAEQPGQVLGGGPLHIEHGGVCDTDRHVRPLVRNFPSQDRSYQGPYACPDLGTTRNHSASIAITASDRRLLGKAQ